MRSFTFLYDDIEEFGPDLNEISAKINAHLKMTDELCDYRLLFEWLNLIVKSKKNLLLKFHVDVIFK